MLQLVTTQKKVLLLLLVTINGSLYSDTNQKSVFLSVNEQDNVSLMEKIC